MLAGGSTQACSGPILWRAVPRRSPSLRVKARIRTVADWQGDPVLTMEGTGFTRVNGRSRTGTKSLQTAHYGVYGCDDRNTAVVDLVDADWTRSRCPLAFLISRADASPRLAHASDGPAGDCGWTGRPRVSGNRPPSREARA